MDPIIAEAIKLGFQMWFTALKMSGKTQEEIDQIYLLEKAKFDQRKAEDLPDVED